MKISSIYDGYPFLNNTKKKLQYQFRQLLICVKNAVFPKFFFLGILKSIKEF